MKKSVLNLDLHNDQKQQQEALKIVSRLSGIDGMSIDQNGKTLTVTGTVDPVSVVDKLRKNKWPLANIISVDPAKEPGKKEEPKKEEAKKGEPKKEEAKKGQEPKKENEKKIEPEMVFGTNALPYQQYRPYYPAPQLIKPHYHVHHTIEENPNACVIC